MCVTVLVYYKVHECGCYRWFDLFRVIRWAAVDGGGPWGFWRYTGEVIDYHETFPFVFLLLLSLRAAYPSRTYTLEIAFKADAKIYTWRGSAGAYIRVGDKVRRPGEDAPSSSMEVGHSTPPADCETKNICFRSQTRVSESKSEKTDWGETLVCPVGSPTSRLEAAGGENEKICVSRWCRRRKI